MVEAGPSPGGLLHRGPRRGQARGNADGRDRGEYDSKPAHTFGAACREWLRYLEHEEQVAERTLMTDRGAATARLSPFFGEDTPIGEITTKQINEYRTAALLGDERIGRGRPLKRTTVSRDMTNLSAIFKRALEEGWIATNPYLTAKKVKQKPAKSRDYNAPTVPELEALVRAAGAEPEAALYRVAALTGLRFGELRALRWRDIEWTAANLHVRKNLPVHATEEKEPKSEEGRSVPMFDQVAREFERLSQRGYLTQLDDLVFVSATGGRLDYEHTKDAFYAALEAAGFAHLRERDRRPKPFTFHDLRHTYGTLAVQIYPLSDVQATPTSRPR